MVMDAWAASSNATVACPVCDCGAAAAAESGGLPLFVAMPIIFFLVCLSGLFSGLTLGLMGLDPIGLQIVQKGEDEHLAKCAQRIAPIREKGNMLLCTLLLGNVAVNSALSILSADIFAGLVGFLVSTAAIVIFGEIIPQATCSKYALQVGALTVPLVKVLMYSPLYILTKPMSVALDYMLGRDLGTVHSRTELMEMMKLQVAMGAMDEAEGEMARQVAEGALSFRDKKVGDVMTPAEDAYMISSETRLGYETIRKIFETGFSRIPVYGHDKSDYKGLLYTKDLMLADPEDEMKIGDFIHIFRRKVETFFKTTKLVEVLSVFKKGGTHMGLVREVSAEDATNPHFTVVGVLTLEDVVEEILQDEIVDETDVYIDVDLQKKVIGRDKEQMNLEIFNPVWHKRGERLSGEEVAAISTHLRRKCFGPGSGMELGGKAIEWLVRTSDLKNQTRCTPLGVDEPLKGDILYRQGTLTDQCTLVLQGKFGARVGREEFYSEAGAFTVLARNALMPEPYTPDFEAFVLSKQARILVLSRGQFLTAQGLDKDRDALARALNTIAAEEAGEASRKQATRGGGFSYGSDRSGRTTYGNRLCPKLPCMGVPVSPRHL